MAFQMYLANVDKLLASNAHFYEILTANTWRMVFSDDVFHLVVMISPIVVLNYDAT